MRALGLNELINTRVEPETSDGRHETIETVYLFDWKTRTLTSLDHLTETMEEDPPRFKSIATHDLQTPSGQVDGDVILIPVAAGRQYHKVFVADDQTPNSYFVLNSEVGFSNPSEQDVYHALDWPTQIDRAFPVPEGLVDRLYDEPHGDTTVLRFTPESQAELALHEQRYRDAIRKNSLPTTD